jgi:hypothetical protein
VLAHLHRHKLFVAFNKADIPQESIHFLTAGQARPAKEDGEPSSTFSHVEATQHP